MRAKYVRARININRNLFYALTRESTAIDFVYFLRGLRAS